jgi:hypothetical protein
MFNLGCIEVRPDMINGDKGKVQGSSEAFGKAYPDKEGPQKSRTAGNSYCINVIDGEMGLIKGRLNNLANPFSVEPAGQFRDNALIGFMEFNLGCNDITENGMTILHEGSTALIT